MNHIRVHLAMACFAAALTASIPAVAQSVEERLISTLAAISADAERRTEAFMRDLAPRQASLKLGELSTANNFAVPEGRAAIRAGYLEFARIIDDMDSFDREEEMRVHNALSEAVSGFPPNLASEAQTGFKRGYARTSAKHAALRAAQRHSIRATLELVEVIERSVGGVSIANGRLVFMDRETQLRVSHLFSELGRLELEEQKLERAIEESRREPGEARTRQ